MYISIKDYCNNYYIVRHCKAADFRYRHCLDKIKKVKNHKARKKKTETFDVIKVLILVRLLFM